MRPLKNYSTTVSADRSISEIQGLLARAGATRVMFEYNDIGGVKALVFMLKVQDREMPFKLPAKPDAVYKVLFEGKRIRYYDKARVQETERNRKQQCLNVAWKIMLDWIDAQFALIELDQAESAEIFMPYLMVSQTKTLYESAKETGFNNMLGSGKKEEE